MERPHWLQRSLAGFATLVMAVITAWGSASPSGIVLLLPLAVIALPLFVREREAFRVLCLVLGGFGLLLGTLLAVLGLVAVIPSAIVLLLAATADPRRRRVLAGVYAVAALLVTAAVVNGVGSLAYDVWLRPSYAYSVDVEGRLYTQEGLHEGTLWEYGVTGVHETPLGSGTRLKVTYDESLPEPRRAALREVLTAIPGAGPLKDCGTGDCD
ncbi:hypothetical protein ACODT5_38395 [Streptomyces sp. 5.8]|uniref:hypothetical protein n=1 Tax=Streptomyces sp. 5.8 TaxID=3406571 RepID=UPI003BB78481